MRKLFKMLIIAMLATRVFAQGATVSKVPSLRVALMDFISEDNSYRSSLALENLVSALQAEVSKDTNYDWVERAELKKAEKEFKLAGFGLIDRSEAIRSGHWVKADWGIFGAISTNSNGNRTLSLEIVNLQRADVLAETNIMLLTADSGRFQFKSEYVSNIAMALRTLLNHARKNYLDSEKRDAVAFLFLSVSQSGMGDTHGDLEDVFRRSLFTASTNSQRFHLIRFQRAGAAMDEANLVLSGLAENDSNAWEKVADHYVWGDARVDNRPTFDRNARKWQDQRTLSVKLNVWDGRAEPQVIALTLTNETTESFARELTRAMEPLLRRDGAKPIVENVRPRISDSFFAKYTGLPVNFWFDSPAGRRQWFDAVQLLETACFFNPGNTAAREELLRLRWGTALPNYNAGSPAAREELGRLSLANSLKSASRNEFFFARRRSEAWRKYVEQFGFKSALAKPHSPSIAAEYVLSAWRPFEVFGYAQENQSKWGVPRDVGLRVINEWENQFGSELVSRLCEAPEDPAFASWSMDFLYHSLAIPNSEIRTRMIKKLWPRILERARKTPIGFDRGYGHAFKKHFDEIGQPGGEEKLLSQLNAANKEAEVHQRANNPPPQPVRIPRVADIEPARIGDIFSVRPMLFSPPLVEPDTQTLPFPSGVQVKSVKSMVFHDGTLWLAVEVDEPVEVKPVNSRIEKEFRPVSVNHTRLWKMEANTRKLGPVAGSIATNNINGMMLRGETLWLALNEEAIAALNVKTGEWRRYDTSAGVKINADNQLPVEIARSIASIGGMFGLADTSRGIAAIGGISDLLFLENGSAMWQPFVPNLPHQKFSFSGSSRQFAGLKDKLLLYNSQLLLCDLRSNTWTQIADRASCIKIGRLNSMASDDHNRFWIAGDSGLHDVNPDTGQIRSQWVSVSPTIQNNKYPHAPVEVQERKSDSQLINEIHQKLELRHQFMEAPKADINPPNLFVPSSRLSDSVFSVVTDGDFLWVITTKGGVRAFLYHPASHSWVGGFSIRRIYNLTALASGGGKLWLVAQPQERLVILGIDTTGLKSTPRARWLPDIVSQDELAARISDLSQHEQAVYRFFSGDDAAAVKLLQSSMEKEPEPESLFLLHSLSAGMGASNQSVRIEQQMTDEFPDSLFTKALVLEKETRSKIVERLTASPQPEFSTPAAQAAWMLRICDVNGAGSLDEYALSFFFEIKPDWIPQNAYNPQAKPAAAAAEFFQRYDMNRDGRLQSGELTAAMQRAGFWPGGRRFN